MENEKNTDIDVEVIEAVDTPEKIITTTTTEEVIAPEEEKEEKGEVTLQGFLDLPEAKEFIEKVRKQEKAKLYGEIQKRADKIKTLEGELVTLKTVAEAQKKDTQNTDDTTAKQLKELQDKVERLSQENRKKELDLYTANALNEAGDELILDLVKGDTEEEIKASIELAKVKYAEIVEKARKKKPTPNVPSPTNPPQAPSVKSLSQEEISKMSASEWAKYREQIKKQMGLTK